MNAHEVPNLQSLAEPYQLPGALPDGISVSVALIASTPTGQLKEAARSAVDEHFGATLDSSMRITNILEPHYEGMKKRVSDSKHELLEDAQRHAAAAQDRAGMYESVGFYPHPDDLKNIMAADELVAQRAAEVEDIDEYPPLVEAREDLIYAMVKRGAAEMALPTLENPKELGNQIDSDITRLSRRGRIGSAAAGLLLGAGAALGLLAGSSDEMPNQGEASIATALVGSAAGIGAIAGTGAGMLMTNRFARRRAQKLVRKAETQSQSA